MAVCMYMYMYLFISFQLLAIFRCGREERAVLIVDAPKCVGRVIVSLSGVMMRTVNRCDSTLTTTYNVP
jgi:hypothetical protein